MQPNLPAVLTFPPSQVQEAVRAKGQSAIGVAPAAGGPAALRLAPTAGDVFQLAPADNIVVIARD